MQTPLIAAMRHASLLMRGTALTVLIAFVMLILEPTVAAAQTAATETEPTASSADAALSKTLQRIEEKLERLEEKLSQQLDGTLERSDLKQLRQTLAQLDQTVRQGFSRVEQHLLDHQLAPVILERHQAAVAEYQAEYEALIGDLDAIEAASDEAGRRTHAQAALARLKAKQNKRRQQPFDPEQLPNFNLRENPDNKPKETAEAFTQAGLFDTPFVQLAALGDFTYDKLPGASNPAYLAETDEIRLTPAIKAKAAELDHDPVKIYHWVRNHVEWLPSWGAIQDADLTLSSQRGNAMDIAGLAIALLRASKIPARYVHGTIDVPAEAFRNWAGGFTDVKAAAGYAASGGIPITSVISGGKISKIRLEHIWVEAAIDYHPSRGAKNFDADSWVGLDPSYKQYDHLKGLDALAISGIDPELLAQSFLDSGTVNESESWVTGFNPQILQDAQTQAQQKLEAYVQNQMQNPTVGDVIGGAKTIVQEFPTLPSSLPNRIVTTGARYDKLPGALQQKITYAFAKDILGDLIEPVSFPFARVNNRKITLSFKPASEADEEALASLLPQGEITDLSQLPASIPSYLIKVVPELKVDGETLKTGSAMKLGEEFPLITAVSFSGRGQVQAPRTYQVIAGSYLSVNAVAGSVSPEALDSLKTKLEQTKARLESNDQAQIASLTREELLGDLFRTGSLGYYAQLIALSHIMGLQTGGHYQLAAGTGTVGYEPKVSYFFGIPRSVEPGGVVLDIHLFNISGIDDGDPEKKKQFAIQTGILSSALEHAVPEQMFVNAENPGEAISAVKALQKANAQGQRIYHITPANQGTILSNIRHDQATITEIRNALNAGKEVITHTDAVSVPGWSGAGYLILDPVTGDGAYKISGGGNGGFYTALLLTIVGFIVSFFALQASVIIGALLLIWEFINFKLWIDAIKSANSSEDFNKANFGQSIVSFLGLVPFASTGVTVAVLVQWYGLVMAFMLTNAL